MLLFFPAHKKEYVTKALFTADLGITCGMPGYLTQDMAHGFMIFVMHIASIV
jgi:hypothetical protein